MSKITFFSENLKNLTVRSGGKQKTMLPDQKDDSHEEKMDVSEAEKDLTHPTSQSKYIKQAKNASSKANAEKQALNAIRDKIELERVKEENIVDESEETLRKERTRTPARSGRNRTQKSANRNSVQVDSGSSSSDPMTDSRQGKALVGDSPNKQSVSQYNSSFPDFRSGTIVDGKHNEDVQMDTNGDVRDRDTDVDNNNTPSESKYIKRKHSSKTVTDNKPKLKSKSPEPIVLTPREPPGTRTSTYTVNMELGPTVGEMQNGHKPTDSPPERKKVSWFVFTISITKVLCCSLGV